MKDNFEPSIIAFCCNYCPYCSADLAGLLKLQYPPNIRVIKVPCVGRVGVIHILKALENGADGVYLAGCLEGNCQYLTGNLRAKKKIQYVKGLLSYIGIEKERIDIYHIAPAECSKFVAVAEEMTEKIKKLGPSPMR